MGQEVCPLLPKTLYGRRPIHLGHRSTVYIFNSGSKYLALKTSTEQAWRNEMKVYETKQKQCEQDRNKKFHRIQHLLSTGELPEYLHCYNKQHKFYILTRYNNLRDVNAWIRRSGLTEEMKFKAARETLLALKELHLLGFVSRDVKMDNFGVHITQDNRLKFCIYDFELSQKYEATRKSTIGHGTTEYAPLVQMNKSRASYPVDDVEGLFLKNFYVQTLGWFYCLYDIFCGEIPWNRFTPAPEFIVSNENFSESKYRMISAKKYDCVMDAIFKIILRWLKTPKIFDMHFYDEILSILKRGCFICEHCESNGCSGHCKEHYNTNNRNYS